MWSPGGGGDGEGSVFSLGEHGVEFWMNPSTLRLEQRTPGPVTDRWFANGDKGWVVGSGGMKGG